MHFDLILGVRFTVCFIFPYRLKPNPSRNGWMILKGISGAHRPRLYSSSKNRRAPQETASDDVRSRSCLLKKLLDTAIARRNSSIRRLVETQLSIQILPTRLLCNQDSKCFGSGFVPFVSQVRCDFMQYQVQLSWNNYVAS